MNNLLEDDFCSGRSFENKIMYEPLEIVCELRRRAQKSRLQCLIIGMLIAVFTVTVSIVVIKAPISSSQVNIASVVFPDVERTIDFTKDSVNIDAHVGELMNDATVSVEQLASIFLVRIVAIMLPAALLYFCFKQITYLLKLAAFWDSRADFISLSSESQVPDELLLSALDATNLENNVQK